MEIRPKLPYLLVLLLSSCSILDVREDTYAERFPSKGLDVPYQLPIDPKLALEFLDKKNSKHFLLLSQCFLVLEEFSDSIFFTGKRLEVVTVVRQQKNPNKIL